MSEYPAFQRIPRFFRTVTVTEKIDGTNGLVSIDKLGVIRAGSRNRWLDPDVKGGDNMGFALWVRQNQEELAKLGVGNHYGEWYGCGIQRGYGLRERRFALFKTPKELPACCEVVPRLFIGEWNDGLGIQKAIDDLRDRGSSAVPGYMNPEGVVIFHHAASQLFKFTFDGDAHKGIPGGTV